MRRIVCVDFDGVIHRYTKGWHDGVIYDTVVPGFFDWALKAKDVFRLVIYSSRSSNPEMRDEMKTWLAERLADWHMYKPQKHSLDMGDFEFASEKPPALVTIDDRGVTFKGDWLAPELQPDALAAFKPWNMRP